MSLTQLQLLLLFTALILQSFLSVHFLLSFYGFYMHIYNMYLCFFIHFNHIIALTLFAMFFLFPFLMRKVKNTHHTRKVNYTYNAIILYFKVSFSPTCRVFLDILIVVCMNPCIFRVSLFVYLLSSL